jgi:hypothetical protein
MVHLGDPAAKLRCPKCKSVHVDAVEDSTILICLECGYEGKIKK